jgi:hypothetical protein
VSRSRLRIPEPYRAFGKLAKRLKWTVSTAGNGHLRWQPPVGRPVFTASSPGSGASADLAKLRRALTEGKAS